MHFKEEHELADKSSQDDYKYGQQFFFFLFFENEPYAVRFKVSLHVVGSSEVTREPSELLWNGKILAAFLRFCSVFYLFIYFF